MFIQRDHSRTEEDDFALNVEHHLKSSNTPKEAVPLYSDDNEMVGWCVQDKYE